MKTQLSRQIIPLLFAPGRTRLKAASLSGSTEFQQKMTAIGIYPGAELEILDRQGPGNALLICVKGIRLGICRESGSKIRVELA